MKFFWSYFGYDLFKIFPFLGCKKICLSFSSEGASKASDLVPEGEEPICLVIGEYACAGSRVGSRAGTYGLEGVFKNGTRLVTSYLA